MSLRWTSQCYSCFSIFPTPFKKHLTKRLLLNPIKIHWFTYRLWCYCRVKVWAPFWVWKATNLRALTLSCQSLSSKFHQSLGLSLAQALKSQQSHPRNIHPGTIPPPQETLYKPISCSVPWYFSHKLRQILSCAFPNKFLKWYIWSLLCSWRCGVSWVPAAHIPFSLELQYFHWGNLSPKAATQLLWTHNFPLCSDAFSCITSPQEKSVTQGSCELPDLGTGNQIHDLCKSSMVS